MAIHKRGTGTVYKRGNTWWIQYYVHGRPVLESSGCTEKSDAETS
jgi:hypothetical protein